MASFSKCLPLVCALLAWSVETEALAGGEPEEILLVTTRAEVVKRAAQRSGAPALRFRSPRRGYGSTSDGLAVQRRALLQQIEGSLERAKELFYKVKLEEAGRLLERELQRSGEALAFAGRFDLLRDLLLWRAICLSKGGDAERAQQAFVAAVLIDPGAPDAARFPPVVIEAHAGAVKKVGELLRGTLEVEVKPSWAKVSLYGQPLASNETRPRYGQHWLVVTAIGFLPVARRVTISDKPVSLRLNLERAPRSVVARQVEVLRAEGQLERLQTTPAVAAALGRLEGLAEVLIVEEERGLLSFVRLRSADGVVLAKHRVKKKGGEAEVRGALAALWPPAAPDRDKAPASAPIYKRWWFWTLIGVAVVGGTVGGVVAATSGKDDTYTFRVAP